MHRTGRGISNPNRSSCNTQSVLHRNALPGPLADAFHTRGCRSCKNCSCGCCGNGKRKNARTATIRIARHNAIRKATPASYGHSAFQCRPAFLRLTRALMTLIISVLVLTSSMSDIREANYSTNRFTHHASEACYHVLKHGNNETKSNLSKNQIRKCHFPPSSNLHIFRSFFN